MEHAVKAVDGFLEKGGPNVGPRFVQQTNGKQGAFPLGIAPGANVGLARDTSLNGPTRVVEIQFTNLGVIHGGRVVGPNNRSHGGRRRRGRGRPTIGILGTGTASRRTDGHGCRTTCCRRMRGFGIVGSGGMTGRVVVGAIVQGLCRYGRTVVRGCTGKGRGRSNLVSRLFTEDMGVQNNDNGLALNVIKHVILNGQESKFLQRPFSDEGIHLSRHHTLHIVLAIANDNPKPLALRRRNGLDVNGLHDNGFSSIAGLTRILGLQQFGDTARCQQVTHDMNGCG